MSTMQDSIPAATLVWPLDGPGSPLNASVDDLAALGYVEQEFRVSGQATRYRLADPRLDAQTIDAGHRYATRLLVRRPSDPAKFNGTAVVEWLNVSAGQDLDFVYGAIRELIWRRGYAWIGVSAQRVGVERLVTWNPERYAGLSLAAPLDDPADGYPLDPALPFTGAAGGDVLCWDVFSQVARLLRHEACALLGMRAANRLIAAGESQSAFRLSRYFNAIQPLHGLFDGFLLYDRGGPHLLRSDVHAKLIAMGSEFFAEYAGAAPQDQTNQRWWDLAGASHVSQAEMANYVDPQVLRDGTQHLGGRPCTLTDLMAQGGDAASRPLWSRVPNGDLMKAALHALDRWIAVGAPPPSAPRLQLDEQGRLVRDAQGQVQGGVRLPAYEVPSAVNVGLTDEPPRLAGYHLDFSLQEMRRRYGSHTRYVDLVIAAVDANRKQGFLLDEDAVWVVAQARQLRFSD